MIIRLRDTDPDPDPDPSHRAHLGAHSRHTEGSSLGELAVLPGRGRSSHSPQAHGLDRRDIYSTDGLVGVSKYPPQLPAS